MSDSPHFLIVKYVPDIRRMEPVNVGVILWVNGAVLARFYGEDPENLDRIRAPNSIRARNHSVYRGWVRFWRDEIKKPELPIPGGKKVAMSSPDYLDALRYSANRNYLLVPGGFLMDRVESQSEHDALDELFRILVADELAEDSKESALLREGWKRVITKAGLKESPHFQPEKHIPGSIRGVQREYRFSAVIGNGTPEAVLQKVVVSSDVSVNDASFKFAAVRDLYGWSDKRCASFIHVVPGTHDVADSIIQSAVEQLRAFSTVINVAQPKRAVKHLKAMELPLNGDHSQ